jgi:hypothetical protein
MAGWLRKDLAANRRDWTIAFWHHPPYSKGFHDSDLEDAMIEMRQVFVPILEEGGADLVLCGHSHAYERSFLLNGHYGKSDTLLPKMLLDSGDGREDGKGAYHKPAGRLAHKGTVYVVAGSAGSVDGGDLNHPVHCVSLNIPGSFIIDIKQNRLDAKMLDYSGTVRDYFSIFKGDEVPPNPSAPKAASLQNKNELPQFDFEDGVRGWNGAGGLVQKVSSSSERAFHGTSSLAVDLANPDGEDMESYVRVRSESFPASMASVGSGSVVTFRAWVPEGGLICGLEPYVQDKEHLWIGNGIAGFKTNEWNTYLLQVPCDATGPMEEIGCHFFSKKKGRARVYLDMISSSPIVPKPAQ